IRDFHVTGVQTCALPILRVRYRAIISGVASAGSMRGVGSPVRWLRANTIMDAAMTTRTEWTARVTTYFHIRAPPVRGDRGAPSCTRAARTKALPKSGFGTHRTAAYRSRSALVDAHTVHVGHVDPDILNGILRHREGIP